MKHGHVTGTKKERRMRQAGHAAYAERAAKLAQIYRDKTIDELLAMTPATARAELRRLGA